MMGIPSSCECGLPPSPSSPNLVLPPGPGHLGSWHRLQARLRLVSGLRTSSPTCISSQPGLQKAHGFPKAPFGAGLAREDLRIVWPHGDRGNSERSPSDCSGTTPTQFEFRLVQTAGPGTHHYEHNLAGGFGDNYILEPTCSSCPASCLKSKLADGRGEDLEEAARSWCIQVQSAMCSVISRYLDGA